MDPTAAWRDIQEIINRVSIVRVRNGPDIMRLMDLVEGLRKWLRDDGFLPENANGLTRQGFENILTAIKLLYDTV